MSRIINAIKSPKKILQYILDKPIFRSMSDETYLKWRYYITFGKELNLKNPITFNEKMNWAKLYDRKAEYTIMADKYLVREYVKAKIGEEYLIPLIGVWDNPDQIDFGALPTQFVLKCNHNSGTGMCICKDKSCLDIEKVKAELARGLKEEYFWHMREWPYKNIPPKIIAEKFMQDGDNPVLPVYKFFCFNGEPTIIQTIQNDTMPNESIDYFDVNWNSLDLRQNFPGSEAPLPKPLLLTEMVEIATRLADNKKGFIRVDLYTINQKVYFSEYTFFSDAGMAKFYPEEWDMKLGELIGELSV